MRLRLRFLPLLALAVLSGCVALAGCGSSSGAAKPDSTLLSELSYFPSGSPLVLTLQTDPNSDAIHNAQALEGRFPAAALGQAALTGKLQTLGINYTTDIRPLFGHPVAIGAAATTLGAGASSKYLVVWATADQDKLRALIKKLPGMQSAGSHDGASLYASGGGTAVALAGATLIFAPSLSEVTAALDRHSQGGGIGSAEYTRETTGLPQNSLAQVFGNLSTVLSAPRTAKARLVPWVAAFRGYGVSVSASAAGLTMRYHLDTTGRSLTASQLPLAAGSASPALAGAQPIAVGIHDPAQIYAFAQAAEQAVNPAAYARFLQRQAKVRARTGVDADSLLKLLTGDLAVSSDTHTTLGRVGVSDPAAAANDLTKLATAPNALLKSAQSIRKLPGGFYAIQERKHTIDVGVVGSQLVAGTATPDQLRAYAATPAVPSSGAKGALAFRVGLPQLLSLALKNRALPPAAQTILSQLGDITGWSSSSPSGIDGSAQVAVK